ncbi:hypothetical protein [Nocardiopsis sp. EMB25]|nr:hypothetical protein [Nocardiopsis sp. EMB25]
MTPVPFATALVTVSAEGWFRFLEFGLSAAPAVVDALTGLPV